MMNKKNILFLIGITFIIFLVLWNCSAKGVSYGEDDVIHVFVDSTDWPYYKDVINNIFGEYVKTPIMERRYLFKWVSFDKFKEYKRFKNIFIIGRLNSQEPVSDNVKDLLNPEIIDGVKSGKFFYIPKKDLWSTNQYVLFLVAENRDAMIQKIIDLGDLAYQDFRKYYFKRLKDQMYKRMEQKDLQKYIENNFPFSMRIQHDYFIADENIKEKYVWIRRFDPDRSMLVHWVPLPHDFQLNSRWVIDERNRLAKKIYSGDVVVEDETKAYSIHFKNWRAVKLEGTWRNDSLIVGGPFGNVTFVDKGTQRIYMIDYYVQAVGRRKVPFLDQLNVILYTFDVLDKPRTGIVDG
jgi:hypothetical protein